MIFFKKIINYKPVVLIEIYNFSFNYFFLRSFDKFKF